MPSLITDRGMCWLRAMLAHEWRVTYMVRLVCRPTSSAIFLSRLLTRCRALRYCVRSLPLRVIMGRR